MWLERFRQIAMALPEVVEEDHWGRPSFRVNKKIFATLWPDDGKGMIKLTPDQQDEHVERKPRTFEPVPGGWGLQGATFVQLTGTGAAGQALLRSSLLVAWKNAAPKSLVKQLEATKPTK
jgi:hypothetical protein